MEYQEDWGVKIESKLCKHFYPLDYPYLESLDSQHAYLVGHSSYERMNPTCATDSATSVVSEPFRPHWLIWLTSDPQHQVRGSLPHPTPQKMLPWRQESHLDLLLRLSLQCFGETRGWGWGCSYLPSHTSCCKHRWDLGLILIYFQAR